MKNVTVGKDLKEVRQNSIPWQELMQQPGTGTCPMRSRNFRKTAKAAIETLKGKIFKHRRGRRELRTGCMTGIWDSSSEGGVKTGQTKWAIENIWTPCGLKHEVASWASVSSPVKCFRPFLRD